MFESYDPFTFMILLLFLYFILILFIIIIIYNIIHRKKIENQNIPTTTTCLENCIPKPTALHI